MPNLEAAPIDFVSADLLGDRLQDDGPFFPVSLNQLSRVAFLAAETAVRFERSETQCEAIDWMLTPRELFHGQTPLEACLEPYEMLKGVIFHRVADGLDGSPTAMDALLADSGMKNGHRKPASELPGRVSAAKSSSQLFTALCRFRRDGVAFVLLYVTKARAAEDVLVEIHNLLGADPCRQVVLCPGFRAISKQARLVLPPELFEFLSRLDDVGVALGEFTLMMERELGH